MEIFELEGKGACADEQRYGLHQSLSLHGLGDSGGERQCTWDYCLIAPNKYVRTLAVRVMPSTPYKYHRTSLREVPVPGRV